MISAGNVTPFVSPDRTAMREHLEHLFGGFLDGYHDGKIEIAWTDATPDASGKHKLRHAEYFGTDELDEAADRAAQLNSTPMVNVYVGAALRNPDSAPFGRSSDADAWALTALYVDLDDPGTATAAKDTYGITRPTFVCVTGREPHTRAQLWWRLDEPLTDPDQWRAVLDGMAATLGGDTTVTNAGRVMRLAGSVAWPVKEGRVVELTTYIRPQGAAQSYPAETVQRALCRDLTKSAQKTASFVPQPSTTTTGLFGHTIQDGRERYMRQTIAAVLLEYIGTTGTDPTPQELFDAAWPQYERSVDLSRPGRGPKEFAEKCEYAVKRFHAGKIAGMRDLDEAVRTYRAKGDRNALRWVEKKAKEEQANSRDRPSGIFEYLDIAAIKTLPDPKWLVDGLVIENATGFIYGPPGCGKTFVSLSMALSLTVAMPDWWGRKIERSGPVVYISSEGQGDMKFRIAAWEHANQVLADGSPFYLIRETINFMDAHDVSRLVETVAAIVAETGAAPAAVFVDTVSRVLPGADENLQKDMTLFIRACDTVRQKFGCCVIGVHHTSRAGNLRGSTVIDGAGDFILSVEREEGETVGKIRATKIKAAADGWEESFKLTQIAVSVSKSSLVAEPTKDAPQAEKQGPKSFFPDAEKRRRILKRFDEAWERGEPFSAHHNAEAEGRYAVRLLMDEFGYRRNEAKEILQAWMFEGRFLKTDVRDAHTKMRGLRVTSI